MLLTLHPMIMGCGTSKNSRAITPAKEEADLYPDAWVKKNGLQGSQKQITVNGHGPIKNPNEEDTLEDTGPKPQSLTQDSRESSGLPVHDGLSTYSKQDSMGLFDLVGRMTADSQGTTTDTIDTLMELMDKESSQSPMDSVPSGSGTSRKSMMSVNSVRENTVNEEAVPMVEKDITTDSVVNKLLELQQLLGPNIFQANNGYTVGESKSKYIVVNDKGKKGPSKKTSKMKNGKVSSKEELASSESSETSQETVDASQFPPDLWDGDLERALKEINAKSKSSRKRIRRPRVNAEMQTDNDPITDEAPEFAAKPPYCRKVQLLEGNDVFSSIDANVFQAPNTEEASSSLRNVVNHLIAPATNELQKVRAFFLWITLNIKYDWQCADRKRTIGEILQERTGVCKDYCKLFTQMCKMCDIRVKKIHGFAKGFDFKPGHHFQPIEDTLHAWNVVFVMGSWRFIDCTWGAGFTNLAGRFQRRLNEHFFLTDPDQFIWTHFPYDDGESNYCRWQLLDNPITLETFNSRPKVTSYFFNYNLRIRQHATCPVIFSNTVDIQIQGISFMRYKFKFFSCNSEENINYNRWVLCQFKEKRMVVSFATSPPEVGQYYLKIYGRPEDELQSQATPGIINSEESSQASCSGLNSTSSGNLNLIAMFLLECVRPLPTRLQRPFPPTDVPWGPTQAFFDGGVKAVNVTSPLMTSHGTHWNFIFETTHHMLADFQLFDSSGTLIELDEKQTHVKCMHSNTHLKFALYTPDLGFYKFLIYAMPKPTEKGRWKLPLVYSLLLDVQTRDVIIIPKKKGGKKTKPNTSMMVGAMRH